MPEGGIKLNWLQTSSPTKPHRPPERHQITVGYQHISHQNSIHRRGNPSQQQESRNSEFHPVPSTCAGKPHQPHLYNLSYIHPNITPRLSIMNPGTRLSQLTKAISDHKLP